MIVKNITITNFRNYEAQSVNFSSGVNVLLGDNAQGKTNLLEAVYLCSVGRSARTPRDKEMIRVGEARAKVRLEVVSRGGADNIEIVLDRAENKRVAINGMPISRIGELMGVVASVFFSPDEMKIIKDSPSDRRRFMDIGLCQLSKAYFYLLSRYNKILAQRNKLLKSGHANNDTLDVWDAQICQVGSKIVRTRQGFVERLGKFAELNHDFLTDGKEHLTLEYEGIRGASVEEIADNYARELLRTRERDLALGFTNCGLQKDDIKVSIGGIDARSYGSQGQQRTAALSLKLSELDLHKSETGEAPILLLDDVLSELDSSRQIKLIKKINDYQTILTCANLDSAIAARLPSFKQFIVKSGAIK